MNKLWTIAVREFMVRVKSKSFILATLLTPLAFGAFFGVSMLIGHFSKDKPQTILVYDEKDITANHLPSKGLYSFEYSDATNQDSAKAIYEREAYDIFITIPEKGNVLTETKRSATYLSKEKLGLSTISTLENKIAKAMRKQKIADSNIDQAYLSSFDIKVSMENEDFVNTQGKSKESKLNTIIGSGLGFIMGFLMYMVVFVYGGMVMRSVMEEKINRIVEVIISSVKPFQLMLGKIIGVGGVGLAQLLVWIILIPLIIFGISFFIGGDASALANTNQMPTQIDPDNFKTEDIALYIQEFMKLNWALIIPVFIIFFLGGYFIYAALFAAIGAAMGDDMGESNSLMFPIIVPVIIAFTMLMPTLQNPNGSLAVFGSMFPLFSPILMPARLAFDPPWWQIVISIVLLILTVIFMIWIAGRIYRVGILLYGKKVNLKELAKWMFYKA